MTDVKEEQEKITDDGEKDKKIAALQKSLELKEKQLRGLQKLLEFRTGVYHRRRELISQMKELKRRKEKDDSVVITEASSQTPNEKHPRNDTDQEKEEMKRNIGALQQLVKSKDSVIRKQKTIIKGMEERQRRTEEFDTNLTFVTSTQNRNGVKLPVFIDDVGAAEEAEGMRLKTAVLERLLEEERRHNQTLNGIIQEMWERQGRKIIFIERNGEIGKCALLHKIRQTREEIRCPKERRTPPTESDTKDNGENRRNEHTGNSKARLPTIYEEEED